jgi:cytochrome c oxidase subunit IV
MSSEVGQQHPLGIYYKIWILLFVLSGFSYAVDYFHVEGALRWFLVILFMTLKAGFILSIFMHVVWERLALVWTILGPPIVLIFFISFMAIEGNYTEGTRYQYRGDDPTLQPLSPSDLHHEETGDSSEIEH